MARMKAGYAVEAGSVPGRLAVRAFDGDSITNPGRSTLVLIDEGGKRLKIADGEVTFLGWIGR